MIKKPIYDVASPFSEIISDFGGVRLPWIGSTADPLYKQYKYNTGIDLWGDMVYSYANGVVVAVGQAEGLYVVTVQYDVFSCLRYAHLKDVGVIAGDIIQTGAQIGKAKDYVRFEYATKEKQASIWAVRVGTETFYKQNPLTMFGGV